MIVNRLPFVLKQRGLSIRELSRLTGITYTTIRAVYHGQRRSIQIDVMDALCRVLDIQPADIFKYYPDESAALAIDSEIKRELELLENKGKLDSKNGKAIRIKESNEESGWHVW